MYYSLSVFSIIGFLVTKTVADTMDDSRSRVRIIYNIVVCDFAPVVNNSFGRSYSCVGGVSVGGSIGPVSNNSVGRSSVSSSVIGASPHSLS